MANAGLAVFVVLGVLAQCPLADARTGRRRSEGSELSRTVALSEDGYQSVARLRSDPDMKAFVRRVLRSFGREVADEGPLSGFVQFYSGTKAVQTYSHMREELNGAAWTQPLSAKDVPARTLGAVRPIGNSQSDAGYVQPKPRTEVTDEIRTSLMNKEQSKVSQEAAKDHAMKAPVKPDVKKTVQEEQHMEEDDEKEEQKKAITGKEVIQGKAALQKVNMPNAALLKANEAKAASEKPSAKSPSRASTPSAAKGSEGVALEPRSKQQPRTQLRAGMHPQAKQTSVSSWGMGSYVGNFFKKVVGALSGSASSEQETPPTSNFQEQTLSLVSMAVTTNPEEKEKDHTPHAPRGEIIETDTTTNETTKPTEGQEIKYSHALNSQPQNAKVVGNQSKNTSIAITTESQAVKKTSDINETGPAKVQNAGEATQPAKANMLEAAKSDASSNQSSQAIVDVNATSPQTGGADASSAVATENGRDPNPLKARIEARKKARMEAAAKAKALAAAKQEDARQRAILQGAARAAKAAVAKKAKQEALDAKRFARQQAAERAANHSRAIKSEMRLAVEQSFADAKAAHARLSKASEPPNLMAMGPELPAVRFRSRKRQDSAFQLPDVEKLLASATLHFSNITSQTKELESQAASKLAAGRDALLEMRQSFQRKLEESAEQNEATRAVNQKVKANITVVRHEVSEARSAAFALRTAGNVLRKTLLGLSSKLSLTEEFLDASLNVTDDSEAEALIVLKPTTPAPTLEHFLNMARAELGIAEESDVAETLSLLEVGRRTVSRRTLFPEDERPATATDVLKARLKKLLEDQNKAGEELRSKFADLFGQAETLHRALLGEQQQLNATLASLVQQRSQLTAAKEHLQIRLDALRERIAGFRAFAGKVDNNLGDAAREADSMLTGVDLMEPIQVKKVTSLRATPKFRNRKRRAVSA